MQLTHTFQINQLNEIASTLLAQFPCKIMCFYGEMGAGKTTFIAALARQLGSKQPVSSPTYSLINQYPVAEGKIYHLDLFRLTSTEALLDIGFEDILHSGQYVFIEWPQWAIPLIEGNYLHIELKKIAEEQREITITKV